MLNSKTLISPYALFDRQGLAEKFSKMAAKGWMIQKMTGVILHHYRRIEPCELKFNVVYIQNSGNAAPLNEAQQDFVEACRALGWQLVAQNEKMHIFANKNPQAADIDTDPVVQVENIYTALKREMIGYFILTGINVLNIYDNIKLYFRNPERYILDGRINMMFMYIPVVFVFFLMAMDYVVWYIRAKKVAREENRLYHSPFHKFVWVTEMAMLIWLVVYLMPDLGVKYIFAFIAIVAVSIVVYNFLSKSMKETGGNANENYWFASAGSGIVTILLLFAVCFGMIFDGEPLGDERKRVVATEEIGGRTRYIYRDEIPLKVEDLIRTDYNRYSAHKAVAVNLPGLKVERYYHTGDNITNPPRLDYDIIYTENEKIHNRFLTFLDEKGVKHPVDRAIWQAEKAYKYNTIDSYVLFYPDRIIYITPPENPGPEGCKIFYEKLVVQNHG